MTLEDFPDLKKTDSVPVNNFRLRSMVDPGMYPAGGAALYGVNIPVQVCFFRCRRVGCIGVPLSGTYAFIGNRTVVQLHTSVGKIWVNDGCPGRCWDEPIDLDIHSVTVWGCDPDHGDIVLYASGR